MKSFFKIACTVALGFTVWLVPSLASWEMEAWDDLTFYIPAIFFAGFIAALFFGRGFLTASLCVLAGEATYYFLFVGTGPFGPVGIISLLFFWPIILFGSYLGYAAAKPFLGEREDKGSGVIVEDSRPLIPSK